MKQIIYNGELTPILVLDDNPVLTEETGRPCVEVRLPNGEEISVFADGVISE